MNSYIIRIGIFQSSAINHAMHCNVVEPLHSLLCFKLFIAFITICKSQYFLLTFRNTNESSKKGVSDCRSSKQMDLAMENIRSIVALEPSISPVLIYGSVRPSLHFLCFLSIHEINIVDSVESSFSSVSVVCLSRAHAERPWLFKASYSLVWILITPDSNAESGDCLASRLQCSASKLHLYSRALGLLYSSWVVLKNVSIKNRALIKAILLSVRPV